MVVSFTRTTDCGQNPWSVGVLSDKGEEVILCLVVADDIHEVVVVVLNPPISITTNFPVLSFLMVSIIMSSVLVAVLLVESVLKLCPVLHIQLHLDGEDLYDRRECHMCRDLLSTKRPVIPHPLLVMQV